MIRYENPEILSVIVPIVFSQSQEGSTVWMMMLRSIGRGL